MPSYRLNYVTDYNFLLGHLLSGMDDDWNHSTGVMWVRCKLGVFSWKLSFTGQCVTKKNTKKLLIGTVTRHIQCNQITFCDTQWHDSKSCCTTSPADGVISDAHSGKNLSGEAATLNQDNTSSVFSKVYLFLTSLTEIRFCSLYICLLTFGLPLRLQQLKLFSLTSLSKKTARKEPQTIHTHVHRKHKLNHFLTPFSFPESYCWFK